MSHRLRPKGYARQPGPRAKGPDCDRPLRAVCRSCDYETLMRCNGHRESRCRPCSARYRRRVREVIVSGLVGRDGGTMGMLTLTAPGVRRHRQRGSRQWCPCTPEGGVNLAEWNSSHSDRWNRLLTALRRVFPGMKFVRGIEVQARGALHDHVLMWIPHLRVIDVARVRRLALRAGFGCQLDWAPCDPGSRKFAYYLSKYITKAADSRAAVPWAADVADPQTGEISRESVPGKYRTMSKSQKWGRLTMAQVKARASAYAAAKAEEAHALELGRVLGVLRAAFGSAEMVDVGQVEGVDDG